MKRYIIAFIALSIAVLTGVGIYFAVPKSQNDDVGASLYINVSDTSVQLSKTSKLNIQVSYTEAVLLFDIASPNIINIVSTNEGVFVTGLREGATYVTISARYKQLFDSETIVISVYAPPEEVPTPDDNQPDEDNSGNIEYNPDNSDNSDNSGNEETNVLALSFPNLINCKYENNQLQLTKGKNGIFTVSCGIDIETIHINVATELPTNLVEDLGNKTFKVSPKDQTQFEIEIIINEIFTTKLDVVVL